jgi:hypothetical protein
MTDNNISQFLIGCYDGRWTNEKAMDSLSTFLIGQDGRGGTQWEGERGL